MVCLDNATGEVTSILPPDLKEKKSIWTYLLVAELMILGCTCPLMRGAFKM